MHTWVTFKGNGCEKIGKEERGKVHHEVYSCLWFTHFDHVQGSYMPPESYDHSMYTTALNTMMILPNIETSRDRKVNV